MKTASYFTFKGPGRISISRSMPRGMVVPAYRALAPGPWFKTAPLAEYRKLYFAQLDALDPRRVWDNLHELAGGAEPVLLCYEKPPFTGNNWCHRRMAAEWFADTIGETVEEFSTAPKSVVPSDWVPPSQRALF